MSRTYLTRQKSGTNGINALLAVLLPSVAALAPVNAVVAALTTSLSGANNDLVYTAVTKGAIGNSTTIAYTNPGTPSSALSVSVTGSAITVSLATGAGTAQVETATVTAASGATSNGNLPVTVTSALLPSGQAVVQVALTTASNTAALVATAIRAALAADAAVGAKFTVGGTGADVVLTVRPAFVAANESSMNVAWTGVLGITAVTTSTNTTAGVAPAITSTATQVKAAIEASAAASALVTAANAGGNDGSGVVTALAATALTSGVNGTAGEPWEQRWHNGSLYINASDVAKGLATDNWFRQTFTLVS